MPAQYYINRNDKIRGPFSDERVRELYAEGKLRETDFISDDPDSKWQTVEEFISRASRSRSNASRSKTTRTAGKKSAKTGASNSGNRLLLILAPVVVVVAVVVGTLLFNRTDDAKDSTQVQAAQPLPENVQTSGQRKAPDSDNQGKEIPTATSQSEPLSTSSDSSGKSIAANSSSQKEDAVAATKESKSQIASSGFETFESAIQAVREITKHLSVGQTQQFEQFQEQLKSSPQLTEDQRRQLEKWTVWLSEYRDELKTRFPETQRLPQMLPSSRGRQKQFRGLEMKAVETPEIVNGASDAVRRDIAAAVAALKEEIAAYGDRVPDEKPYLAVVVGQIGMSDHPEKDGRFVQTHVEGQCEILPEGYFVAAIGDIRQPLVFSAIGYTSVAINLNELTGTGSPRYIQKIVLEKLPVQKTVKLRGQIVLEQNSSEILSTGKVELIPHIQRNTPGNNLSTIFQRGWDYKNPHFSDQRQAQCDAHGFYEIEGLTPDQYSVRWSCQGHVDLYVADADLWRRGSAPDPTKLLAIEAFHVNYVTSWQQATQETQNLGTNELWEFYDRPGVSRQGWGFRLSGSRPGQIEISSTNSPWYISTGTADSMETAMTAVDKLQVTQVSGRVSVQEGLVLLAKNFNQKEWVLFRVQKGKIPSPTIVVAPKRADSNSNSPSTVPNQQPAGKSNSITKLSPAQIRETENWLREALKTKVPRKLDFPANTPIDDVTTYLADQFTIDFGRWKGQTFRMYIVFDNETLKKMKASSSAEIISGKVRIQGKTLAETLNLVLESVPGSALAYEIRDGQIVIVTDTGER